jgi:acyl carrier protein
MEFDRCLSMVLLMASKVLGRSVDQEQSFFALGGDSLLAVELLIALEAELDVELDGDVLFTIGSFRELADHIVMTAAQPR